MDSMENMNNNSNQLKDIPVHVRIFKYGDAELKWGERGTIGYFSLHMDNVDILEEWESRPGIPNVKINDKGFALLEKMGISKDRYGYQIVVPELN